MAKQKLMALLLPVEGKNPVFGERCFLAPNATIVGDGLQAMIAVYGSMQ